MITNIGTLGFEQGFAPICSPMYPEITACVGKMVKKPVVRDDQIVIKEMMSCVLSLDHRFGDGSMSV